MDYATCDDATLIRLVSLAEIEAFGELYDRYNRLVFSIALAIVGERALAAEIVLDVFTNVWQRAGMYRAEQAQVGTWLTAIARHYAIDVLRRQKSRPEKHSVSWDEMYAQAASDDRGIEERVDLSMQRERIRTAVVQLPVEQQQALILAYFKGYTHHQIAEALRQPLGTVKTRIRLAVQKLRHMLQEEQPFLDKSESPPNTYRIDETS